MAATTRKHSHGAGQPPGTLIYSGDQRVERTTITVIDYDENKLNERTVATPQECQPYIDQSTVTWIDLTGLHDVEKLRRFGEVFEIHPILLEDILNTGQRPKLEDHGKYMFLVLKMLYRNPSSREIVAEQVSLVLGRNYVLTFQEVEGDVFGVIRDRIRGASGRIRKMGCGYLAYSLVDAIVDNYFVALEEAGERIEQLQEDVMAKPDPKLLQRVHALKREMMFVRKALWPLRELVSGMEKSESELIGPGMGPYLRDVYEHTIQLIDTVESLRDMIGGAMDMYLSNVSNRMNEVMKVLTVIATIFIPLTFVAGVYGMNFEHMPELRWRYGYLGVWLLMILVGVGMAVHFKRRRWL